MSLISSSFSEILSILKPFHICFYLFSVCHFVPAIKQFIVVLQLRTRHNAQGPVARKVDNFIQRIVIFSIAVESMARNHGHHKYSNSLRICMLLQTWLDL